MNMKKVLALALAAVMVMALCGNAFAAAGDILSTPENSIGINGLVENDTVKYYKIIEKVDTASGYKFQFVAPFDAVYDATTNPNGLTATEQSALLNEGTLTKAVAEKIAKIARTNNTVTVIDGGAVGSTGNWSATSVEPGMYLVLVTPVQTDVIYNPMFVSADYSEDGNTLSDWATNNYGIAKKESITLTKEVTGTNNGTGAVSDTTGANTRYDVDIGDTVDFTIESYVPAFSAAYQNPVYEITDTMESGLRLWTVPVVTVDDITLESGDYTITPSSVDQESSTEINTFTVALTAAGLAKVTEAGVAKKITVTYTAKVVSLENATVTEKENEATVKFSNNPSNSSDYSLLEDKTRNYTFSLDANLLGYTGTSYETDELIKVGLKPDGTPWTTTTTYRSGTTWTDLAPLGGATFKLYKDSALTQLYTNSVFNGTVVSDTDGRLHINGLDCGTYYLKEESAPAGFIADTRTFTITISATYTTIPAGQYTVASGDHAGKVVKYDAYDVLNGYTVVVNDGVNDVTSSYTITHQGEVDHKKVDKATYQTITGQDFAGDSVTPINNTQGLQLPSTGGIGTTIFYVSGLIMVLGAAVILVARRRADAE